MQRIVQYTVQYTVYSAIYSKQYNDQPFYFDPSGHFVFMKFCVAQTFLVGLHLGDVLKVLLVVGSKFLFYNAKDHRKMH